MKELKVNIGLLQDQADGLFWIGEKFSGNAPEETFDVIHGIYNLLFEIWFHLYEGHDVVLRGTNRKGGDHLFDRLVSALDDIEVLVKE